MKIRLNPDRHRGGFAGISLGTALAVVGTTAAVGGLGLAAAGAAGAFTPKFSTRPSAKQINDQIAADQTQLEQANAGIADAQARASQIKVVSVISIGLAVLAVGAGGYLLLKKKK